MPAKGKAKGKSKANSKSRSGKRNSKYDSDTTDGADRRDLFAFSDEESSLDLNLAKDLPPPLKIRKINSDEAVTDEAPTLAISTGPYTYANDFEMENDIYDADFSCDPTILKGWENVTNMMFSSAQAKWISYPTIRARFQLPRDLTPFSLDMRQFRELEEKYCQADDMYFTAKFMQTYFQDKAKYPGTFQFCGCNLKSCKKNASTTGHFCGFCKQRYGHYVWLVRQ